MRTLSELYVRFKYGFRIKKPKLLLRIAKTFFEIKVLGKKPFKYIDFAFDYKCNLKCQHCFAKAFSHSKKQMNVEDFKKVTEEAMKLGALDFNFQGGEPILSYSFLKDILKVMKTDRNLISITTNGTLLDEQKILELKSLGVDTLVFSIDSGIPEEHDKFRGMKGTFKRATKSIDLALKNGVNVAINTTLTHKSLYEEGFRKIIDFAEKRKIFINAMFPAPVGNWKDNLGVIVNDDDIAYMQKLRKQHWVIRRDMDSNFISYGCPSVKETMYITAYGDVLPCPFIHLSLGNIFDESLAKIRKRGLKISYFDHYSQRCVATEIREFMEKYANNTKNKAFPVKYSDFKKWI